MQSGGNELRQRKGNEKKETDDQQQKQQDHKLTQKRSNGAPHSSQSSSSNIWFNRILSCLIGSFITWYVLWSSGRIGVIFNYPHYSLVLSSQHLNHAAPAPPIVPFDSLPWQRASAVDPRVAACIPPFVPPELHKQTAEFRGAAHLGLIASKETNRMPLLDELQPLWIVDGVNVGIHSASKSSPVVDREPNGRGTVYVGADNARLYAFDADTGVMRWVYHVRSTYNGIHGTPAVDEERVYIGNYGGWISALNKTTGELIWEQQVGQSIGASPMLVGERVCSGIEMNRPRANGYVACLARRTGQVLFYSQDLGDHTHGTPTAVWRTGKKKEDWSSHPIVGRESATSCTWNTQCRSLLAGLSTPMPFSEDTLNYYQQQSCLVGSPFQSEQHATALALTPKKSTTGPATNGLYHTLDSSAGLFLIGGNTGILYAIDATTGVEIWRFLTRGARGRPLLLQLQNQRRALHQQRQQRHQERQARKEAEAAQRLQEAQEEKAAAAERGEIEDGEWLQEDEDAFWSEEEAREEALEPEEAEDAAAAEDERDPMDHDAWVKEDTVVFCQRAPQLCDAKVTMPWLWLLNNKDNGNQGQIKGTMTIYGHICVFVSWDSFVYAIDINNGQQLWIYQTRSLGMSSANILPANEYQSSAANVIDGLVFVGTHDWSIYCLQLSTGNLIWKYQTGGKIMSSGVVVDMRHSSIVRATCGGSNSYVVVWGSWDGTVYELCASTGVLLAKKALQSGAITNEVAIRDQTLYVSTNGGKVIALRQK